ncbi:hypothetical protein [Leptolyngbya sp. BC1307]|uniref:IS1/IS1595 family N-terminal zinc-binding domain-containing protein n=1 Tax=Leptolyngbya sp. BC1307 TaxID=2029589 RepID=UPI001F0A1323|nr:hypothetical protein [Leptolyngbya sp. BC1307]
MPACPSCDSEAVVKNGFIHNGKQNHRCQDCGRQFVANPENKVISDETKSLIDKLLLEKIPMAGIASVVDVSEPWLQGYVNEKYASVPRQVNVRPNKSRLPINRLISQAVTSGSTVLIAEMPMIVAGAFG